jgi:hypothetical protein
MVFKWKPGGDQESKNLHISTMVAEQQVRVNQGDHGGRTADATVGTGEMVDQWSKTARRGASGGWTRRRVKGGDDQLAK